MFINQWQALHLPLHTLEPVRVMSTTKANYCIQLNWSFLSLSTRCYLPQTSQPIPVGVVKSYIIPSENLVLICKLAYLETSKENFPILLVGLNRSQGQRPPSVRYVLVPSHHGLLDNTQPKIHSTDHVLVLAIYRLQEDSDKKLAQVQLRIMWLRSSTLLP